MIEISNKKTRSMYSLSVKGHANYEAHGKDIVCAAVSALIYTLDEALSKIPDTHIDLLSNMESGNTRIVCHLKNISVHGKIDIIFTTILDGLLLISQMYPNYVKVEGLSNE